MSARMIDLWFIKSDRLKSLRYAVLVASTCMCAWASHIYFDAVDSNEAQRAAFLAREQSRQIRNVSNVPKQDADALAARNIHEALGFDWNTAFDAIEHDLPKSWGVVSMDVGQDKRMMQSEWRVESLDIAQEIKKHAEAKGAKPQHLALAWVLNNRFNRIIVNDPPFRTMNFHTCSRIRAHDNKVASFATRSTGKTCSILKRVGS